MSTLILGHLAALTAGLSSLTCLHLWQQKGGESHLSLAMLAAGALLVLSQQ